MIMMTSFVVLSTSSKLGLAGPPLISRDAPSQPSQLALIASNPPLHYTANDIPHSRLHENLYTHATIIIAYSCAAISLADYFFLHNMGSSTL